MEYKRKGEKFELFFFIFEVMRERKKFHHES